MFHAKRVNRVAGPAKDLPRRFEIQAIAFGERPGVRPAVRSLQWRVPWQAQSLLRLFGEYFDPYTDWHRSHRAIFIHVPRTGGTSVSEALELIPAHFPVTRYLAFDRSFFRSAYKFSIVRNPWDRLLSAHSVMRSSLKSEWPLGQIWAEATLGESKNFEEFVLSLDNSAQRRRVLRNPLFRPQIDWLQLPVSKRVPLDFIGRFERLEEDFETIAKQIAPGAKLPHSNKSNHTDYREQYSIRMREIVADLYARTVKAFDYRF